MKRIILTIVCVLFSCSLVYAQGETKKGGKETVTFKVEQMNCQNCVKKVEKNIAFEKGVTDLKVDLKSHTVEVSYRTDKTDESAIVAAFQKLNMGEITKEEAPDTKKE